MASIDADRIDSALGADGVLAGWLWSFDTPEALDPRRVWSHAFNGPSTPVWMWIRSPTRSIEIVAEWGMYRLEGEIELGENGFLIIVGVSIEASPVAVLLSSPGWIDFGRGEVPELVAGAPVVDAMDMVLPSSASGIFTELLSTNITKQFEDAQPPEVARLNDQRLKPGETFLVDPEAPEVVTAPTEPIGRWPVLPSADSPEQRARYTRMREARQLSLAETSQRLEAMTDTIAGKDTLSRFEANKGIPHDPMLPVALDHVLGAEGHLALVELISGQGTAAVTVPRYWRAPVWIAFHSVDGSNGDGSAAPEISADPVATNGARVTDNNGAGVNGAGRETNGQRIAELHWGSWRRRIDGSLPMVVMNHAALIPLRIITAPHVRWTVGLGRLPGAISINHDWAPDSINTTQEALSTYQEAFMEAFRHAHEHRRQ